MDNQKLSALLYIGAAVFFLISSFLGGNFLYIPLAAVLIVMGLRKLKQ